MSPTPYLGLMALVIAYVVISRERVKSIWMVFALFQVFGATSMATLSALGGSSLTMPQVGVVVLMYGAFVMVAPKDPESIRRSLIVHAVGLLIVFYTLAIGFLAPRVFAGTVDLLSMRPELYMGTDGHLYPIATPLEPRSSNITQSAYLSGSFMTAFATSILFARKLTSRDFRMAIIAVTTLHVSLGVIDWVGGALHLGRVLDFLRNASFSMLDQEIGGVRRLSGSLPEPSAYAGFATPFAVFCCEEWLRSKSRAAGWAGLFMWVLTLASTSSSGIFAFCVYSAVVVPRFVLSQGRFATKTVFAMVITGLVLIGAFVALAVPAVASAISDFVLDLTVNKGESQSAIERGAWTAQAWIAFDATYGLGAGAGSFRCSGLIPSVIGSLGVIGTILMAVFMAQVVRSLFIKQSDSTQRSAGWASLYALAPAVVGATTPDPGFVFAMFAGFALHPQLNRAVEGVNRGLQRGLRSARSLGQAGA